MTMDTPPVATGMVIESLEAIRAEIRELSGRLQVPAPGVFRFYPNVYQTHARLRTTNLIVCPSAVANYGVQIGTSIVFKVRGSAGALWIPAETTIERGTTITLVNLATGLPVPTDDSLILDAFFLGFSE